MQHPDSIGAARSPAGRLPMRFSIPPLLLLLTATPAGAQIRPGTVERVWKLCQTHGGVMPVLENDDQLGRSIAFLGDVDGNGTPDLATAGLGDDDGGPDQGAAYVLFLRPDGRVIRHQKISALEGGFGGDLDPRDQFGRAMAGPGDLDGDGIPDLVVGANYDDDGGWNRGAIWILGLNADGTVKTTRKISSLEGGFEGPLHDSDEFGRAVASLGDLDGDGDIDLAVGAPTDSTGGSRRGAVWILFLTPEGSVERSVKIAHQSGGFSGRLHNYDWFGFSLANLGDFDGDGVTDLAVGAALDDDGGENAGAVWLLFLNADGTVKDQRKISPLAGGFTGMLESPDQFGTSVAAPGDLNGDGVTDLAVGAVKDGDGGPERGAVYVLFLTGNGRVGSHQKISDLEGGFPAGKLGNYDWFGSALAPLGDLDRDGVPDLAIGVRNDDDGGLNRGAVYLTYLNGPSGVRPAAGPSPAPPVVVDLPPPPADDPAEEETEALTSARGPTTVAPPARFRAEACGAWLLVGPLALELAPAPAGDGSWCFALPDPERLRALPGASRLLWTGPRGTELVPLPPER